MKPDWSALADEYWQLLNASGRDSRASVRALVGKAASQLPKDNADSLAWFSSALQSTPQKWFAAAVLSMASPLPRTMLDPLLLAALLEPNPSATRVFVDPCVRALGAAHVAARVCLLGNAPGVADNDGLEKVMYWIPV